MWRAVSKELRDFVSNILAVAVLLAAMAIGSMMVVGVPSVMASSETNLPVPDLKGVEYAEVNGEPLLLDVYLPSEAAETPAPAVIFVHGGAFTRGGRGSLRLEATRAAQRGWIAITIDYRLDETPGHPGEVDDVRSAIRWARQNAVELQLDSGRLALYGISAGGTLASGAAVITTGPLDVGERVVGVVAFSGPMDLTAAYEETAPDGPAAKTVSNYLGCTPQDCAELYVDASPITHASADDPPHFLAQSTAEIVPVGQGLRMQEAMQSVGVATHLRLFEGSLHAKSLSRQTDGLMDAAFDFLQERFDGIPTELAVPPSIPDSVAEIDASADGGGSADDSFGLMTWLALGGILAAGLIGGALMFRRGGDET